MKLNWSVQGGGGIETQKSSMRRVWIFFWNNKLCVKLCKIGFHLHFLSQRTLRKVFATLSEKNDFAGFHLNER